MKIDNIYDPESGEVIYADITLDELIERTFESDRLQKAQMYKRIFYLLENNPYKLTLKDINEVIKIKGLSGVKNINSFSRYHQRNDDCEVSIFDLGISPKSFYYFSMLIEKCCNTKYTITTNNEVNIKTDKKLCEILDIKSSTWSNIKKELMKLNLIRVGKFDNKKYYKVNPCYVGKRNELTASTYYLFRDELIKNKMIDEFRVLYWDKLIFEEYNIDLRKPK